MWFMNKKFLKHWIKKDLKSISWWFTEQNKRRYYFTSCEQRLGDIQSVCVSQESPSLQQEEFSHSFLLFTSCWLKIIHSFHFLPLPNVGGNKTAAWESTWMKVELIVARLDSLKSLSEMNFYRYYFFCIVVLWQTFCENWK